MLSYWELKKQTSHIKVHIFSCAQQFWKASYSLSRWRSWWILFSVSCFVFADGCHSGCEREGGGRGPKLWLHVQAADHRQQQRGQNVFPLPLRRRCVHLGFRQHGGHRLQSEDRVQERQEDQTADLGKWHTHPNVWSQNKQVNSAHVFLSWSTPDNN